MFKHLSACAIALVLLILAGPARTQEPGSQPPVVVKIEDDKPVAVEATMPVDPTQHCQLITQQNMLLMVRVNNQLFHQGYLQTVFNIDGRIVYAGNPPGRMTTFNQALPNNKDGKQRTGTFSVYEIDKIAITQEIEVVATKSKAGEKRRRDAAMVRYIIDNKDGQAHKVGIRVQTYTMVGNQRGCLFVASNQPGKLLDGVELKGDKVPDYLQVLQRPDPKDPGMVANLTCNLGSAWERPERLALTRLLQFQGNQWDLNIQPAQNMNISALGIYWDPKEIKPGSTRRAAYAFGQGVAPSPEGDGLVAVNLSGSFEPGKLFTIAAQVQDPANGQTLTLELPKGMERVEGALRQPVPVVDEEGNTMVLWKARVLETGRFPLRVHSSTGMTQTKVVTISRP